MENKNNKGLIILIIILIICLIASGYFIYKMIYMDKTTINENSNKSNIREETKEEYQDTFSNRTESGKVRVTGYTVIEKVKEECYGEENCEKAKTVDYVFFKVLDTKNKDFINYISNHQGNNYFRENAVGLGCIENNQLTYINHSNELGMISCNLTEIETNKILNSNQDKKITLELERLELTGGSHAPSCYSHITYIKVVN